MAERGSVVVLGGTSGIGRAVAAAFTARGLEVVLSSRDRTRAESAAAELGGGARGIVVDLSAPDSIAAALDDVGPVEHLVIGGIERDDNAVRDYDVGRALRLVTLKLVGYTEAVHALLPRMGPGSSVVLFGGLAKDRPYAGSTTVSTVNGGITGMVRTLAVELAPIRVNAVHPGVVGDSPYWSGKPAHVLEAISARTPTGRLVTTADVVGAVVFLLENQAMNGVNLPIDGGWLLQ